jgi:hypothetical protein
MKYNLIFTGLRETPHENTEETLVFLGLEIEHWIEFGSVQRFGQRKPENENIRRGEVIRPTDRLLLALSTIVACVLVNAKTN